MVACNPAGFSASVFQRQNPALVLGSDYFLVVQMIYGGNREPYSMTGFVGATGCFSNSDGTTLYAPGYSDVKDQALGKINFDLPASTTSLLAVGEEQSFQVNFEDALGLVKTILQGQLWVQSPLFS